MKDRDKYGGDFRLKFSATGYFRIVKTDRWWLVTPTGNAFISFGVNHVGLDALQRAEVVDYWLDRFGLPVDVLDQEWISPYQKRVEEDAAIFGFNTLGCQSPTYHFPQSYMPYVHSMIP